MSIVTLADAWVGLAMERALLATDPQAAYADTQRVSDLIHEALLQAGLGSKIPNAPLADIIEPGMTVLLKPNWVLHRNLGDHGMTCMLTHPEFILAALEEVLRARPGRVILGDAPVQSCDLNQVLGLGFRQRACAIAEASRADIAFVDFRRTSISGLDFVNGVRCELREERHYILFDLADDSLLGPISRPEGRFRVLDYDPRKLAATHCPGHHRYLLCREAFEADVILSLPKLKLHSKAGLTGALKNIVGLNGSKDFLPHHRVGGSSAGGDCYPGRSPRKRMVELLLDMANRYIGTRAYTRWRGWASAVRRYLARCPQHEIEGNWHGNDTCWRMVLDLNRILLYGRPDGSLAGAPQRTLWSLTDAIVCGEGEGPLSPSPLVVGAVSFSGSAPAADAVHAALMNLDEQRIPLVRESFGHFRWPLVSDATAPKARFAGRELGLDEVAAELGVDALAPSGWTGQIQRTRRHANRYSSR